MKILFWLPYPNEGASNRYRVEQYLGHFSQNNINFTLHPFWSRSAFKVLYKNAYKLKKLYFFLCGTLSRTLDVICIFNYDIVFIHREAYPVGGAFFETILFVLNKPIIFDFDDAIFLPSSSPANNFMEKFKDPKKVSGIIKMSRHVIVSNKYLADFAFKYNSNVSIIPTSIDTEKFYPDPNKILTSNNKIIIGWMGSVTTIKFLGLLEGVFRKLSAKYPNIVFKIIGEKFLIEGLSGIINQDWSLEEELQDLRSFDIGVMPVPDNEWAKGKCGFKGILCMSVGIPVVASSIEANKEILTDGVDGYLVDNTDENWIEKLSYLIENPGVRREIGLAARKTVEEKYSVRVNWPRLLEVVNKVYRGH